MSKQVRALRAPVLMLWAVMLSAFTAVLGAAPLRVLRHLIGGGFFWLAGITTAVVFYSLGWIPLAAVIGAQTILIGTYTEFEERDFSMRQAASFSVLLTGLFISSSFYTWTAFNGKGWLNRLLDGVQVYLDKAKQMNIQALENIKAQDIVVQLPSGILIFLILSLGLALIFERNLMRWAGLVYRRRDRLSEFSAPDAVVWLFIVSLLGAFAELGVKGLQMVAMNIFNVCSVIYFFQGLAVLGKYFETFKVGFFWRFMWVLLLVVQLPILMSMLGLVDYWVDFRKMFVKRSAEIKKKQI